MDKCMTSIDKPFTAIDNEDLMSLLTSGKNISKLDIKLMLLILRLTVGCHRPWAKFRLSDLIAIGIDKTHAKQAINNSIAAGVIEESGRGEGYRVSSPGLNEISLQNPKQRERLTLLIGKNLSFKSYLKSNHIVTNQDTNEFPM